MQACVNAAVADVTQRWNRLNEDPVQCLPDELRVACFARLNLRNRIAVSHVSRSWRASALSAPLLWNSFDIRGRDELPDYAEDKLRAMLDRSQSADFHFKWACHAPITNGLLALVLSATLRMQSLALYYQHASTITPFLARPAPRMRLLTVSAASGELPIPRRWAGDVPPPLQEMRLERVSLPEDMQPLLSLRSLSCEPPRDARRLFLLCPNVQHVILNGVEASYVLPTSVPSGLKTIGVYAPRESTPTDRHDLFSLVRPWQGHRFEKLGFTSRSMIAAVDFFLAGATLPWELRLECLHFPNVVATLQDNDDRRVIVHMKEVDFERTPAGELASHLRSLTSLSLQFSDTFLVLWRNARVTLPSLICLSIIINGAGSYYYASHMHRLHQIRHPLGAPRLRSVKWICHATEYSAPGYSLSYFAEVVVGKLHYFITLDALGDVTVVVPRHSWKSLEAWSGLLQHTPLLYVQDCDTGERLVLQKS